MLPYLPIIPLFAWISLKNTLHPAKNPIFSSKKSQWFSHSCKFSVHVFYIILCSHDKFLLIAKFQLSYTYCMFMCMWMLSKVHTYILLVGFRPTKVHRFYIRDTIEESIRTILASSTNLSNFIMTRYNMYMYIYLYTNIGNICYWQIVYK